MVLGMEPVNWLSCKSKYLQSTDTACDDAFKGPHVMPPLASTHSSSAMTMTPGRPQVHNHSPPTTWLSIKLQPASSGALRCRLHAGCLHTMRQGAACCSLKQEVQRTGEPSHHDTSTKTDFAYIPQPTCSVPAHTASRGVGHEYNQQPAARALCSGNMTEC